VYAARANVIQSVQYLRKFTT